jgi:release factor glutamine methyltransferase
MAFDISAEALRRTKQRCRGVDVDIHLGTWSRAVEFGPFGLVLATPRLGADSGRRHPDAGPAAAFDAGFDGRLVLDPLCAAAPDLLTDDGTLLIVHSEFSGVDSSLAVLRQAGLKASVIARQWVPFGPVLTARAGWLQRLGLLEHGRRPEELVVIRADMP